MIGYVRSELVTSLLPATPTRYIVLAVMPEASYQASVSVGCYTDDNWVFWHYASRIFLLSDPRERHLALYLHASLFFEQE